MRVEGVDTVLGSLQRLEDRIQSSVHNAAEEIASVLENYAKTHHPWTPRTGLTDVSTKGEIAEETREFVMIALSAGTSYSVFLELARSGAWAWLWPAVTSNQRQIMSILARHLKV